MEKNKLLSIVQAALLAFILVLGFQFFFGKNEERKNVKEALKQEHVVKVDIPESREIGEVVKVETPLYSAEISTVNGKLLSLTVKKYNAQLVSEFSKKMGIFPLMTISTDEKLSKELANISLTPSMKKILVKDKAVILKLEGNLQDGRKFIKELTFHPDSYRIDVKTELKGEKLITLIGPDIRVNEAHTSRMGHIGPVVETEEGIERLEPQEIKTPISFKNVKWAGEEDKYFLMAIKDTDFSVSIENINSHTIIKGFIGNGIFYGGPKELNQLENLGMDKAIDFGIFGFLAKPFLKFFLFLHQFIPNWGLVIIVLTILIKIILHPLTHKSFESMKKMQELAPKLEEIKNKYKDNPQKLNEEMMKLYKEAGVNPMGGCLPILLQIPIFFALYEIFLNAVELKGASFLWVPDLSMPDSTFIMPILMGASMILQQKLTPTTNPQQEKIFMIMAVVFTFMFASFPAGLVLYWLTNNIITAIQNFIINRMLHRESN
ncbi:membrane protein insertase YidC [Desulfurobacterium thermolithotrophum]|uniref:membrane protein insertase YidC n=1 Tax=Desulfurobacterium thermolithotrophum TaxID=64160 RepID=UPI0013D1A74B|nr:membrane protein insertase YidC [Desulfurobacterium thermolithotrophum]